MLKIIHDIDPKKNIFPLRVFHLVGVHLGWVGGSSLQLHTY